MDPGQKPDWKWDKIERMSRLLIWHRVALLLLISATLGLFFVHLETRQEAATAVKEREARRLQFLELQRTNRELAAQSQDQKVMLEGIWQLMTRREASIRPGRLSALPERDQLRAVQAMNSELWNENDQIRAENAELKAMVEGIRKAGRPKVQAIGQAMDGSKGEPIVTSNIDLSQIRLAPLPKPPKEE